MTATRKTYVYRHIKCWIILATFSVHVGGARKWPENEATAMKGCGVLVVHFRKAPMHCLTAV